MRVDRYEYLTNLDTETERYSLVHRSGDGWFARRESLLVNGEWRQDWYSETFPNQVGARTAINQAFGL
jgi:hypothetical protein